MPPEETTQKKSIAEAIKVFLDNAWNDNPDTNSRYAAAVATKFVGFVDFCEKMFRNLAGRVKAIEDDLAGIKQLLSTPPAEQPQQNGTAAPPANGQVAVAGASAAPAPAAPAAPRADTRGMVRLGADNQPLTPEEQEIEERMDRATRPGGDVDESRYVQRS